MTGSFAVVVRCFLQLQFARDVRVVRVECAIAAPFLLRARTRFSTFRACRTNPPRTSRRTLESGRNCKSRECDSATVKRTRVTHIRTHTHVRAVSSVASRQQVNASTTWKIHTGNELFAR